MTRIFMCAILAVSVSGCCDHSGLIKDAQFYAAINHEHAHDSAIPKEAQLVGQDNEDAWLVHAWRLGGSKPSDEVLNRVEGGK